jgi:hypothetical protein
MRSSGRNDAGSLELSRLTLASLAIWLAVTCLVAVNRAPVATATAAAATDESSYAATVPVERHEPQVGFQVALAKDDVAAAPRGKAVESAAFAAVSAAPAGASHFVFPEDAGGQLLSTKLIPPAKFDVWPVPFVDGPKPWRTLKLDPLPRDIPPLSRTIIPREPQSAALTSREGLSLRPLDLPGLPAEIALSVPTPIQFLPLPQSHVFSVDPQVVPFLAVSAAPPKEKIDPAANPARSAGEGALFHLRMLAASLPAGFVRLAIPDPFEQVRAVQLGAKLADTDPSLFPAVPPSRPNFPVIEIPADTKK